MKRTFVAMVGVLSTVCGGIGIAAHHSFSAEYDVKQEIELKGVVTKVEWTNPHVRFYVDVKDDKGGVTNWDLELMSVNTLTRAGWDRHSLKVGDAVTVRAYRAIDGTNRGNARGNITLANGKQVFAGQRPRGENEEINR